MKKESPNKRMKMESSENIWSVLHPEKKRMYWRCSTCVHRLIWRLICDWTAFTFGVCRFLNLENTKGGLKHVWCELQKAAQWHGPVIPFHSTGRTTWLATNSDQSQPDAISSESHWIRFLSGLNDINLQGCIKMGGGGVWGMGRGHGARLMTESFWWYLIIIIVVKKLSMLIFHTETGLYL